MVTGDAGSHAARPKAGSKPMRPFEARLAALRGAKSPACGCGHAHTADDGHAPSHAPSADDVAKGGP